MIYLIFEKLILILGAKQMKVKSFKMFDKNQKVFFVRLFLLFSHAFISPHLLIQPVNTICQILKFKYYLPDTQVKVANQNR